MNSALRKAAIVLDSLDTATADVLYEQLSEDEAAQIRQAVLALDPIDPNERRRVIHEFLQQANLAPTPRARAAEDPAVEFAGNLARAGRFPQPAPEPRREGTPTLSPHGRALRAVPAEQLAAVLAQEQPRVAAVILSRLPERVEEVLEYLPDEARAEIALRIARLELPAPEVVDDLERHVAEVIAAREMAPARGVRFSPRAELPAGSAPAASNSPGAPAARPAPASSWRFADVERLPDGALLVVLQQAPPRVVQQALAGAPESLLRRITRGLPRAQAEGFRRHLREVGRLRLRDMELAQQQLADLAARLDSEGYFRRAAERRAA